MVNLTGNLGYNCSFNDTLEYLYSMLNASRYSLLNATNTETNNGSVKLDTEHLAYYILWTYITPVLFCLIILIGVTGNSLVIYTICSSKVKRTSTNILLLNLAVTDILFLLVCVPFKAYKYAAAGWALGDVMCMGVQYMSYVTAYVTVWSLVAVSVIRFLSVVYANSAAKVRIKQNVVVVIIMIWILSLCTNIPALMAHHTKTIRLYTYCGMHRYATEGIFISFFTFGYLLPLLCISVMYVLIVQYLNHHSASTMRPDSALARSQDRKHKVFKIVLVVVLVFAISWLPFHVNLFIGLYGSFPAGFFYEAMRVLWDCLAYSNSCVNPIIYNYVSRDFRTAFKQVICGRKHVGQEEMILRQELPPQPNEARSAHADMANPHILALEDNRATNEQANLHIFARQ